MKLVNVHLAMDGGKATFFFTGEGRVDFRALVRDVASKLRLRVEMRQIGKSLGADRIMVKCSSCTGNRNQQLANRLITLFAKWWRR